MAYTAPGAVDAPASLAADGAEALMDCLEAAMRVQNIHRGDSPFIFERVSSDGPMIVSVRGQRFQVTAEREQ